MTMMTEMMIPTKACLFGGQLLRCTLAILGMGWCAFGVFGRNWAMTKTNERFGLHDLGVTRIKIGDVAQALLHGICPTATLLMHSQYMETFPSV
jgi:hypothetical protein